MLTSSPILRLETDAFGIAIGVVLSQEQRPIAYISRKFCRTMLCASTYVQEMCTIVESIKKWRHYLLGSHFVMLMDHASFRHFMSQTIQIPNQERWLHQLINFDFNIKYCLGRDTSAIDSLTRLFDPVDNDNHDNPVMAAITTQTSRILHDIAITAEVDPYYASLKDQISQDPTSIGVGMGQVIPEPKVLGCGFE